MTTRMASTDTHRRPPSSVSNARTASEQGANEPDVLNRVSSRRASWVKRLSSISISQQPRGETSPAQLSPAVSCSNGSVTLSHDGSMVGRQTPPRIPPNKLVKRSSSTQTPRDMYTAHGTGSVRTSFRRPATSHQRSATLHNYHSMLPVTRDSPSLAVKPSSASTDSEAEYQAEYLQFFTATSLRARRLSKRFQAKPAKYKRVFPDEKHRPTLVLARAVTTGAEELEESASEAGESVFYVSRPGTPLSYTAAVAAPKPGAPHSSENNYVRPSTAASSVRISEDASRRRRSFSLADLLPSESSAKKQRLAKPGMKPTRGSSQRVSSEPVIPTMGKRSNTHVDLPARRILTDPAPPKHDLFVAAGIAESNSSRYGARGGSSTPPLSALPPPRRAMTVPVQRSGPMPQLEAIASAAPTTNHVPPSPLALAQAGVRVSRHSMAPSEQASTLVGSSDNEVRAVGSADEDADDLRSETLYDSLRTGATRSVSGGARGPRIETIFDESPPAKLKVTALRDLLPSGTFGDDPANDDSDGHSIAEDHESFTTPVRNTVRPEHRLQEAVSFSRQSSTAVFPTLTPSSPPSMPKPLSLGTLEWDSTVGDDDRSSRWSFDEHEGEDPWVDFPSANHLATPITLRRSNPRLLSSAPNTKPSTPQLDQVDRDARSSIFDWSEQQIADKSSGNRTPPRPRTVHGKKDANRRDSRSVGRRVPSGLHARSQSVPVVPDVIGKRNTVVTNKFGTWGIGSKGVTEDWNDDFDFSELPEEHTPKSVAGSQRIDSGSAMVVPKSIQEQQNNVLANISLLREWGLLIEELKEQKIRAISLGIMEGPQSGMWEEVDAMIDLADQEAEHGEVPHATPPSSPGFDEDAFDEVSASPQVARVRRKSGSPNDDLSKIQTVRPRKSILPPNDRIFAPQTSPKPPKPKYEAPATPESKPVITRPRKDSEAKARSVIEALQSKRQSVFESPANAPPTPSPKKVPFDTATLRRIVPYVNTLTRKVKDTIRDAEGLYYSPITSPQHEEVPFVMSPFQQDAELRELASHMKLMTVM